MRYSLTRGLPILPVLLVLSGAAHGLENTELVCESPPDDASELSDFRLARALSLDLRGVLPTEDELAEIEGRGDIPDSMVDAWLASDEFAERAVRHHRALLWNNLDNQRVLTTRMQLSVSGGIYFRGGSQATFYRGAVVRCADEPARFDDEGSIIAERQANGTRLEGWVELEPYWAPGTRIKVCAFDAQANEVSPQGTQCGSLEGISDPTCGCGENMRYCSIGSVELAINRSFVEDIERRMRDVFKGNRSYLDLFLSPKGYVNGPLVHYFRHFLPLTFQTMTPSPIELERLPDLPYSARDTWVEVDLGENHAGILTSTAFLLRFQTNRARANQFYNSFLCEPFNAPEGGIPLTGRADPDLQVRHGCEYCHAILEPAAAHWGRWGERGAAWLSPEEFPRFDPQCELCAETGFGCTARCRTRYTVDMLEPEYEPYLGWLKPFVFLRDEHQSYLEDGPRLFVRATVADGRLPRCVARNVAELMLGRELDKKEAPMIDALATVFVRSGYRYQEVYRAMALEPAYRRVR